MNGCRWERGVMNTLLRAGKAARIVAQDGGTVILYDWEAAQEAAAELRAVARICGCSGCAA